MDILAHSLWAGVGLAYLSRRKSVSRRTVAATVALAALPDVVQMAPLLHWGTLGDGSLSALRDFALAAPGEEPQLPPMIETLSHHLHCALHSSVVAALITLLVWWRTRRFWIPLAGWWSHIVIDFFTHSADYYPVPVFYPFTYWGFDGIAWNRPWFLALNYTAMALCIIALARTRRS